MFPTALAVLGELQVAVQVPHHSGASRSCWEQQPLVCTGHDRVGGPGRPCLRQSLQLLRPGPRRERTGSCSIIEPTVVTRVSAILPASRAQSCGNQPVTARQTELHLSQATAALTGHGRGRNSRVSGSPGLGPITLLSPSAWDTPDVCHPRKPRADPTA